MTSQPHYFHTTWIQPTDERLDVDVCVYGGNAAGVVAAVKASELGMSAVLLQPGQHLGGMTTGGLSWTDYGSRHVIGGMSRAFYRGLGAEAGMEGEYWHFWPSDATRRIEAMCRDAGLDVRRATFLDQVQMAGRRIVGISLLGGLTVRARQFIDCSYEGDLMAAAGVSCTVGREANTEYDETLNGVQCRQTHQFDPHAVDPFVVEGDPSSGLLPFVESRDLRRDQGRADHKIQAYNFRICMTDDPAIRVDWRRPEGYDPMHYELAARWFRNDSWGSWNATLPHDPATDPRQAPNKFDILDRATDAGWHKADVNNHGPCSSDFIGANYTWPTADYAIRERIFQEHVRYQQGLYWFMANDPRVPGPLREVYQRWGLPRDEFTQTGHWPHQLYPREARRMIADHVITEHDCTGRVRPDDSVGMGSYTMDSHNCSRFVAEINGKPTVMNEGDVQVPPTEPYPVSYRAIVPRRGECTNLIVPVCFSASHIAYGSARMEPVFMVLGESAGCAANRAIADGVAVQDVDYHRLRSMLDEAGQVLELHAVTAV
ncbi:MAG: FAD-dependent oxidoreductase [Planctomycetota bacterium]